MNLRHLCWTGDAEAIQILRDIDVDPYGIDAMLPKMQHLNILIPRIPCKVANIIKQEMLSLGGDAAVARGTVACSIEATDVLLMGTLKQVSRFCEKISLQPFRLGLLAENMAFLLRNISTTQPVLQTGRREIILGDRTRIMAILNVTPDSFSDGGRYDSLERAVAAGMEMAEAGADMLDIGGESTRPGAEPVPPDEELRRVIPVIQELAGKISIPISVDTAKAVVAREALKAGAEIINDISAMRFDQEMSAVVAASGAAVALMHMRGEPKTMQQGDLHYRSLMGEIVDFFYERLDAAEKAGIARDCIIIDPGIGFGKTKNDNFRIIKHLDELKVLGRPVMLGPSRKSFIAQASDRGPQDRFEGTAAAVTAAIVNGCHIVRVHDVKAIRRVAAVADAVIRA